MKKPDNFEMIKVTYEENRAVLTINRPESRNALSKETVEEISLGLGKLQEEQDVHLVILTGEGEKSFAAGADIKQLQERTLFDGLEGRMQKLCRQIELFPKPTIAAVNGYALGGGCELALACDIRIASENAVFGLPELSLSMVPGAGGTQRLARLIGKGRAMELILTGQTVTAVRAEQIGLVSRAVSQEELMPAVIDMAKQITSKGPIAVRLAKLAIHAGFETDMDTALIIERLAQTVLYSTDDKNEGVKAFLEKRSPQFRGH